VKKIAVLAGLAVTALASRPYLMLRPALAAVAPELRSVLLPYVSVSYTAKTLPFIRPLYRFKRSPGPGVTMRVCHVGSLAIRVLVTTPDGPRVRRPAVLMLHSGGMVVGSPQIELPLYGRLAREAGVVVVAPDYRLAPEHSFPAPLDDCMTTLQWMREQADELGIAADRIAVVGTSAGGGLAAAVTQRCHDEGIPLRAQGLVYPMLDDRTVLQTQHGGRGRLVWTPESNRFGWTAYLGRSPELADAPQYSAPARRNDLSGLPPAWIGVGDLDLFYDEDVAYADKLRDCGVQCELMTVPGMYHAADGYAPEARAAEEFLTGLIDHIRTYA
jgi:acetyl esterase/lipase